MEWLFDNRGIIYILLALILIAMLAVWWRIRDRRVLYGGVGALCVLLLFTGVDLFVRKETDEEQVKRKVKEIAEFAARPAERDKLSHCISESFVSPSGRNKKDFLNEVGNLCKTFDVKGADPWDLRNVTVDGSKKTASVRFSVTVKYGNPESHQSATCEAIFRLDDDGEWRMRTYKIFLPNTTEEFHPGYLP